MHKGLFVTFEGGEGSGKSTLARLVADQLTKDGFDFNSFEKALPYLISIGFVVLIVLFFIRQFSQAKVFFKGEDGMYERLEEIFSELYIKYISDIEVSNLNTSKKKIGKNVKKEQPEGSPKRRRNSNKSLK